ncbi:MAG: OB-fold nucleic acid binding domain-containing protein [Candidatus Nanoarchaeia archaeon]
MHVKKLLIICLIWIVLGLFGLFLLSAFLEPQEISLADLEKSIGKTAIIKARVENITYKENVVFLKLTDGVNKRNAVFFGNPVYEIIQGDYVAIKGVVQIYKGEPEIIIKELACLSCANV